MTSRHGTISLSDLLTAAHRLQLGPGVLLEEAAALMGIRPVAEPPAEPPRLMYGETGAPLSDDEDDDEGALQEFPFKEPLEPFYDPADDAALEAGTEGGEDRPLPDLSRPWNPRLLPPLDPLLPERIAAATVEAVTAIRQPDGALDVSRIVERIASAQPLHHLPCRPRPTLRRGLQLLLDMGEGMMPFRGDQAALRRRILTVVGDELVNVQRFVGTPLRKAGAGPAFTWDRYASPPPGTPVVVVSDVGIGWPPLHGADRATENEWLAFAQRLAAADCPLTIIVPYPPARWPKRLARAARQVAWESPRNAQRPESSPAPAGKGEAHRLVVALNARAPDAVKLARFASLAIRVEPVLLRCLRRRLMPWAGPDAEADLWLSDLVDGRMTGAMELRHDVRHLLRDWLAQDPDMLHAAAGITFDVHAEAPPAFLLEERAAAQALAGDRDAVAETLRQMEAVVRRDGSSGMLTWARGALERMPEQAARNAAYRRAKGVIDAKQAEMGHPPIKERRDIAVSYRRHADTLTLGAPAFPSDEHFGAPALLPLVVTLRHAGAPSGEKIEVPQDGSVTKYEVGYGDLEITVSDGRIYRLPCADRKPLIALLYADDGRSVAERLARSFRKRGVDVTTAILTDGDDRWRDVSRTADRVAVLRTESRLSYLAIEELSFSESALAKPLVVILRQNHWGLGPNAWQRGDKVKLNLYHLDIPAVVDALIPARKRRGGAPVLGRPPRRHAETGASALALALAQGLDTRLAPGHGTARRLAVVGPRGSGKTVLIQNALREPVVRNTYLGGVVILELASIQKLGFIRAFLSVVDDDRLWSEPETQVPPLGQIMKWLPRSPMLLAIDGAPTDTDIAAMTEFAALTGGGLIVETSRREWAETNGFEIWHHPLRYIYVANDRRDEWTVMPLVSALRTRGTAVMASDGLPSGRRIQRVTSRALRDAAVFAPLLTHWDPDSDIQRTRYAIFQQGGRTPRPVVPLLHGFSARELTVPWSEWQALDVEDPRAADRLVDSFDLWRPQPEADPALNRRIIVFTGYAKILNAVRNAFDPTSIRIGKSIRNGLTVETITDTRLDIQIDILAALIEPLYNRNYFAEQLRRSKCDFAIYLGSDVFDAEGLAHGDILIGTRVYDGSSDNLSSASAIVSQAEQFRSAFLADDALRSGARAKPPRTLTFADFYDVPRIGVSRKDAAQQIRNAVAMVGAGPFASACARTGVPWLIMAATGSGDAGGIAAMSDADEIGYVSPRYVYSNDEPHRENADRLATTLVSFLRYVYLRE